MENKEVVLCMKIYLHVAICVLLIDSMYEVAGGWRVQLCTLKSLVSCLWRIKVSADERAMPGASRRRLIQIQIPVLVHRPKKRTRATKKKEENLVICVFCFLPNYIGHQVRWTYQTGSHRISHPPSFCGACLIFSGEKDSAIPLPRRP